MDKVIALIEKKEQNINNQEDFEKLKIIKQLVQKENIFFYINAETAIGILEFLGIKEDEMLSFYYELISPENYKQTMPKERLIIENDFKR